MAPPSFIDINKSVKDLFNKGYNHGFLNFDSTTVAGSTGNVEFKTAASHNIESQKFGGNFTVKYKAPKHGLILTEKWSADNVLGTTVEVNNQFAKDFNVILDTTYVPHTAKRSGLIKTEWTNDLVKVNTNLTLQDGPILTMASVVAQKNWLLGVQTKVDIASNELKGTSIAFGRQTPEYTIHSFTIDGREFGASFFHKAHRNVELGAQLNWTVGDQVARFGLASKYVANDDLILRAKVDSTSQVAFAATHQLNNATKLTLSTQFGLLGEIQHKFGLGLEYVQ